METGVGARAERDVGVFFFKPLSLSVTSMGSEMGSSRTRSAPGGSGGVDGGAEAEGCSDGTALNGASPRAPSSREQHLQICNPRRRLLFFFFSCFAN